MRRIATTMNKKNRAGALARCALSLALVVSMFPVSSVSAEETKATGGDAAVPTIVGADEEEIGTSADATIANADETVENANGTTANANGMNGNADKADSAMHKLAADNSADDDRDHDISATAEKDGAFADGAELSVSELTGDDLDAELNDLAGSLDGYLIDDALLGFELSCTDESEPVHMTLSGDWANGLDGYVLYHKSDSGWEQVAYGVADEDATSLDEDATSKNVTKTNKDTDETGKYVSFDVGELGCFAFVKVSSAEDGIEATATTTAFAVYSATDKSLSFYKRSSVPSAGSTFNGKTATAVYTGIENTGTSNPGWYSYRYTISQVAIVDEGIQPASLYKWFYCCSRLASLDLSKFDMSVVTNMQSMFDGCSSLTALDVSGWDTTNVTNMRYMFYDCSSLASLDLSGFETAKVTDMYGMFYNCSKLASLNLSGWNTSAVTDLSKMFYSCSSLISLDVSGFKTSSATSMTSMFNNCSSLTSLDLSGWDASAATSMGNMFYNCSSLDSLDLSGFKTSSVTNMYRMFYNCSSLDSLDVTKFDTSKVTSMGYMFGNCSSLTSLDVSGFKTSAATDMSYMFSGCSSLTSLDVSSWDTSKVTNMANMFSGCSSLTSLNVAKFNTSATTSINGMFSGCSALTSLDVSNWDTGKNNDASKAFLECSSISSLDLTSWDMSNVTDAYYMFAGMSRLQEVSLGANWKWVGDYGYLPTPNDYYIFEADGYWYSSEGVKYPIDNIPENVAMTYYAAPCAASPAFAVYSADDESLSFYKSGSVPSTGSTFNGKTATTVYEDIEHTAGQPWADHASDIKSAIVVDSAIAPYNMENWFNGCSNMLTLDVSKLGMGNVSSMSNMFDGCFKLKKVSLGAGWRWIGSDGYLPAPSSSYIYGADGSWYNEDGKRYSPSEIPGGTYETYYATPVIAFAVYSDDDGSLRFYKRSGVASIGEAFEGKTATAVYTGIETDSYSSISDGYNGAVNTPWYEHAADIKSVSVVDEGIAPASMAFWFQRLSSCTSMTGLGKLDVSSSSSFQHTFYRTSSLKTVDVAGWDTSASASFDACFAASRIESLNLEDWNFGSSQSNGWVFSGCTCLSSIKMPLKGAAAGAWFDSMFNGCTSLAQITNLAALAGPSPSSTKNMFLNCSSLAKLDLSSWDTSAVTSMAGMFTGMNKLQEVSLGANWKWVGTDGYLPTPSGSYVYSADGSWYSADDTRYTATTIPSGKADTYYAAKTAFAVYSADDDSLNFYKRATAPLDNSIFNGRTATKTYVLDESYFVLDAADAGSVGSVGSNQPWASYRNDIKTASVVDKGIAPLTIQYWFSNCSNMTSCDLSNLDTSRLESTEGLFMWCTSLTSLNLSSWDTSKVTDMSLMFYQCRELKEVTLGPACSGIVLPTPNSVYITGADGYWYTDNGVRYAPAAIPSGFSATYYAVRPSSDTSFAVYSSTDGSLSLYKRDSAPKAGDTFNGKTATKVYTGIENTGTSQPWNSYAPSIKNATVVDEGISPTSTYSWFDGCTNLASCDLAKLDTHRTNDMQRMFHNCTSLTSLDLSSWDTSALKYTGYMFYSCTSLQTLNVFGWNTSKVMNMGCMFSNCSSLKSLDLSSWSTSSVSFMRFAFNNMSKLQEVVLSANWKWVGTDCYLPTPSSSYITGADGSWHTPAGSTYAAASIPSGVAASYHAVAPSAFAVYSADDGSLCFYKRSIVPTAGSSFNGKTATAVYTGIETDNYASDKGTGSAGTPWFSLASEIKSAKVVDDGIAPISTAAWFYGCSNMTSCDVTKLDTSRVTDMWCMFKDCSSLTSLDTSKINTASAKDLGGMFWGCSSIGFLNLSGFDTSSTTSLGHMFSGCSSLYSLYMMKFDTANATLMWGMFEGCSSLTELDISSFDTSKVTSMAGMFSGMKKLQKVSLGANWKWVGTDGFLPAPDSDSLPGTDGYWYSESGTRYSPEDIPGSTAATYYPLRAFAVYSADDDSLNFYKRAAIPTEGDTFEGKTVTTVYTKVENEYGFSFGYHSNIKSIKVVDEGISPLYMRSLFSYCTNLASCDLSKLDTSRVTDMSCMFDGCSSLTSLDLSSWDTAKVTDMSYMFRGCSSLTSLDVSKFNTSAVTLMLYMFCDCSSLTSLDVSEFDTSNVTNMGYMFDHCTSLSDIDVSMWNVSKDQEMRHMFSYCTSLVSLDLSKWDTHSLTRCDYMFEKSAKLETVGSLANWDVSKAVSRYSIFQDCASLKSLDLSGWDMEMSSLDSYSLYNCHSLERITVGSKTNLSNITYAYDVVNTNWIKDSTKETVAGTTIMTAYQSLADGETETFYKGADLSITQEFIGYEADSASQTITVEFTGDYAPEGASYTLKNGETKTLRALPRGTEYKVTKKKLDGYAQTFSYNAAGIVEDDAIAVTSTDEFRISGLLPSTGSSTLVAIAAIAIACGIWGLRTRKKRKG